MKISEVNIEFIKPQDGLIAFASFVIEDSFYISSVAIHRKLEGADIALPIQVKANIFCVIRLRLPLVGDLRTFFMAPSSEIIKYFGWGNKIQNIGIY